MLFKRVIYSNGKIIFTDIDPIIPKIMCNIHTHAHTYFRSTGDVCSYRIYKYINPYSRTWHTPHRIWPQQRHGKKLILTQSNANNLWKYYRKRDQSAPRVPRPLGLSPRSLVGSPRTPLGLPQATLEGT